MQRSVRSSGERRFVVLPASFPGVDVQEDTVSTEQGTTATIGVRAEVKRVGGKRKISVGRALMGPVAMAMAKKEGGQLVLEIRGESDTLVVPVSEDQEDSARSFAAALTQFGKDKTNDAKGTELQVTESSEQEDSESSDQEPESALRDDIAKAAARMSWKLGGRREIRKLEEHLYPGEIVDMIVTGTYGGDQGILALTDQRLLFIFQGFVRERQQDFPFANITSIEQSSSWGSGKIIVWAAGAKSEIENVVSKDMKPFVDTARSRLATAASGRSPAPYGPATSAPPSVDPVEQIRKLGELRDVGMISSEEFEEKKAELMKRI